MTRIVVSLSADIKTDHSLTLKGFNLGRLDIIAILTRNLGLAIKQYVVSLNQWIPFVWRKCFL